jgi:hypothetical protein
MARVHRGGVASVLPLGARAQQPERMRRIGVLVAWAACCGASRRNPAETLSRSRPLTVQISPIGGAYTNSISERVDYIGEGGDGADELWIALDV